jgi:hypothetical protein
MTMLSEKTIVEQHSGVLDVQLSQEIALLQPDNLFTSLDWLHVLTNCYGFNMEWYVVRNEQAHIAAAMPVCRIVDEVFSERLVALPFSDYCDPWLASESWWSEIADCLCGQGIPLQLRLRHNNSLQLDSRFVVQKTARWHGIRVADLTEDELWRGLHETHRWGINKAKRSGVTIRKSTDLEDLRAWYALHCKVRKYKYQLLPQPFAFFEEIWKHYMVPEQGFLLLAERDSALLAGAVFLVSGTTLNYKFSASDRSALHYQPNNLLLWEAIRLAHASKMRRLDLGVSDDDQPGLISFKRRFGAVESEVAFVRYLPAGFEVQRERRVRQLLGSVTTLLTRPTVPDEVTAAAGETLYRYFV